MSATIYCHFSTNGVTRYGSGSRKDGVTSYDSGLRKDDVISYGSGLRKDGVTGYGSGLRKDVVNQWLEFESLPDIWREKNFVPLCSYRYWKTGHFSVFLQALENKSDTSHYHILHHVTGTPHIA